jgi:quinol monooxygenase YgiN
MEGCMIVEYLRYSLPTDKVSQFEQAYGWAAVSLTQSPHCLAYELVRCREEPTTYIMRIEWDSREGHLSGFRSSPEFRRYYEAIAPFIPNIEKTRCCDVTEVSGRKVTHDVPVTHVSSSTVIEAPINEVWALLKIFANVSRWHPDVSESRIESGGSGQKPGDIRTIKLRDGTPIREMLRSLSDEWKSYTYSVIEAPLPIHNHSSTVSLSGAPENQTAITWTAEFIVKDGFDAAAIAAGVKASVIELGFTGLKATVGKTT